MESGNSEDGVPKTMRRFPVTRESHGDQVISEPVVDVDGRDHLRKSVVVYQFCQRDALTEGYGYLKHSYNS